ncbi:MAG: aspartate kinase [Candidatus Acidiferrales bacterium]
MKFGGTSVGDASCIGRVVEIVRAALRVSNIIVVVSAMAGVTDKLIEAATLSEDGDRKSAAAIFQRLREQHEAAAVVLTHSVPERNRIRSKMQKLFQMGERLCHATALRRELSLRARDAVSGLGERLSAPLVAAALAELGVPSKPIEATELVVTDSNHGAAEPRMHMTRERCEAYLHPLLRKGIVPVVTGFIGATSEGAVTTLGRGGSDYSATILGAALDADEVVIWKDVDGVLTADPRIVPGARTIPEISYREAAELAYFGSKVLHPKTLRAVVQSGIPVWIRNTFAPDRPGTKITPSGPSNGGGVAGLTAISDVALISMGGSGIVSASDVLGRTFVVTAGVRADVLLISQSSSQNDICFVVSSAVAQRTAEALRHEFSKELAQKSLEHITSGPSVAIVTVVGQKLRSISGIVGRVFDALAREKVNIVAIAQSSSECNVSFVVAQRDVNAALVTIHREFQLLRAAQYSDIANSLSHVKIGILPSLARHYILRCSIGAPDLRALPVASD